MPPKVGREPVTSCLASECFSHALATANLSLYYAQKHDTNLEYLECSITVYSAERITQYYVPLARFEPAKAK
jgi:hypothetical protein